MELILIWCTIQCRCDHQAKLNALISKWNTLGSVIALNGTPWEV